MDLCWYSNEVTLTLWRYYDNNMMMLWCAFSLFVAFSFMLLLLRWFLLHFTICCWCCLHLNCICMIMNAFLIIWCFKVMFIIFHRFGCISNIVWWLCLLFHDFLWVWMHLRYNSLVPTCFHQVLMIMIAFS